MPVRQDSRGGYLEYRHIVSFEETNVVGNVYYANYVLWQGRCREMFLAEYAPDVAEKIQGGLALITLNVSCDYHHSLYAFDEVALRMRVGWVRHNRMALDFEYVRLNGGPERVASGRQETACMTIVADQMDPSPWPDSMLAAMEQHALLEGS
ncbi:MAG TPA: acyl-CoA thioesterase [Deltaproteobacteria bacterium]|nr:acyl-CoA thioesterase [Deltaproteobacteria bacterium]